MHKQTHKYKHTDMHIQTSRHPDISAGRPTQGIGISAKCLPAAPPTALLLLKP